MTGRRRNPVRTLFKVETLTPNSVIIIRAGSAMNTKKQMGQLANELVKKNLNNIIILTLESLDDFHSLNEEQMNKLGWFRKEGVDGPKPT